tara:strand:- start:273 stop:1763 length:1491 start_codon:yes stop_codon:yes gene_type:complete
MATASEAVDAAYSTYLNRTAGASGKEYWTKTWESDYQKAIEAGQTPAQAEAAATASINKHIGGSTEGKVYAKTGITKTAIEGTTGYGTIDDTADWYTSTSTADDPNEFASGMRDEDWSAKLNTTNLENYTQGLNKMYGELQGNTLGQEGLEWWGYEKTQGIEHYMSDAGGNYSFDTASKLADFDVSENIKANTGHQNYKKFGSIGYGNALNIKTGVDDHGDITYEQKYLNLDPATNLNPTGTKTATQYQIDADGEFVVDDAGNKIATGNTATPYSWQYVPDATAPGGYKITPVSFDTGVGGSVVGHNYHMDNYISDHGGKKTFQYPTTGLQNVDASQFTLAANDPNKLSIAQWAETAGGKAAIANNQFGIKNQGFTVVDGKLSHTPDGIDHTTTDSNLGLAPGQKVPINWGGGYVTDLSGAPVPAGYVPPVPEQQAMMGGGGGNTIINLDQSQKSTTAADKAQKLEDRSKGSGEGRKGYTTNKYKPSGNIRTLGIV